MSYFSIKELEHSDKAIKLGIDNSIPNELLSNVNKLINTLDIIREKYGKPITVTSGYRCSKLNKAVGGEKTSAHMMANAADITCDDNKKLYNTIILLRKIGKIKYDQNINEKNYAWIHISTDGRFRSQDFSL